MKSFAACFMAVTMLALNGCATNGDDCCGKPEIVYVDKAVPECTRAVQRVTQVSPCSSCDRFPVIARLDGGCIK